MADFNARYFRRTQKSPLARGVMNVLNAVPAPSGIEKTVVHDQATGFIDHSIKMDIVRIFPERDMPGTLAEIPGDHTGSGLTPQQIRENEKRGRQRQSLSEVGPPQKGRLKPDDIATHVYPIKALWADGSPVVVNSQGQLIRDAKGLLVTTKAADNEFLYLNGIDCIPITDEVEAYSGRRTPVRDDYEFVVYPTIIPYRGVKPHDYFRFVNQTNPPDPSSLMLADGTHNWEGYNFWQITRILDAPKAFQAFLTRGISRLY